MPIGVWVGPTGARLYGAPAQILAVADVTGMAPGARVGNVGPPVSDEYPLGPGLTALERPHRRPVATPAALAVFKQRISDEGIPTIRNMLEALDGYEENGVALETTTEVVTDSGTVQKETVAAVRFSKLSLLDQLFHTVASPPVAYLLFLIGLALLIFEFFTAGVGIAGVVGAAARSWRASAWPSCRRDGGRSALLVAAMVGVRGRRPGRHPALLDRCRHRVHDHRQPLAVRAGERHVAATQLAEPDRRHRRHDAGVHRRHAVDDADPLRHADDRARVADRCRGRRRQSRSIPTAWCRSGEAQWRARTNRATPIKAGEPLRVAAIDGVTLEVEPLEGAAKDYRERRAKSSGVRHPSGVRHQVSAGRLFAGRRFAV